VSAAVDLAVVVLLRTAGRDGDEPRPHAADRPAVPGNPVLRRPADDLAPAERGPRREREAHPAADAAHAPDADLPEANTSKPAKGHKTYPYLLGGLRVDRPNQVWCADITYLPMRRGFLYLVAIMDWFTRKVLAWRISNTLEADCCVEALTEAVHRFGPPEIMNTDRARSSRPSSGPTV
jgi:transposase InsO family protein